MPRPFVWVLAGRPLHTCCGFFLLDSYGVLLYSFCLKKDAIFDLFFNIMGIREPVSMGSGRFNNYR